MLAAFVHYLQNQLSYCLMNFYKFFKIKMGSSRNVFIVFIKNQNYIFYFYKLHMDVLECTGHSKHPLPKHKRRLYTWTSPDGQHWNQIDYIFAAEDGEALYSQQKQDQVQIVAQIMNSLLPNSDLLKKVGKTTRPFRSDLNQIPL